MRVIFIGMHNKPGLPPLCSSTRSGKLIDRIIERVPVECVKANLIDADAIPDDFDPQANAESFERRLEVNSEDILVLLGRFVWQHAKGIDAGAIVKKIYHPAYPKSDQAKDEYVVDALGKIASGINYASRSDYHYMLARNLYRQVYAMLNLETAVKP